MVAASLLLKPEGLLVLEFPYLVDFITKAEFDTIYFEHLSYFSILPLHYLCRSTRMKIIDVEKQTIHGGTVRVILARHDSAREISPNVQRYIDTEYALGVGRFEWYAGWARRVQTMLAEFADELVGLKMAGKKIAAFAASAKGNTRKSPNSLYHPGLATFEAENVYNQKDAEGFIKLNALRLRLKHLLK